VDGPALLRAVIAAGVRLGVTTVVDSVEAVVHASGAVTGVLLRGGDVISCGEVILCTGAAVPALLTASHLDSALVPPIVAAKGVGLLLEGRQGPVHRHVLRTPNRQFACGLHVVPRGEHGVYVGATNRVGSRLPGVTGRVTAGEARQLLTDVTRELSSPLDEWDITALMHGRRPMPLDGLPVAGRTELTGLSVATGTYRNGVLLAPLIADAVHADLDGSGPAGLSPRRAAPDVDIVAVLRQGLGELADHWRYDSGAQWHERLSPLLGELAVMALGDGPAAAAKRQRAAALVRRNARSELIPETIIELLQTAAE
jgi:glycine oxidase